MVSLSNHAAPLTKGRLRGGGGKEGFDNPAKNIGRVKHAQRPSQRVRPVLRGGPVHRPGPCARDGLHAAFRVGQPRPAASLGPHPGPGLPGHPHGQAGKRLLFCASPGLPVQPGGPSLRLRRVPGRPTPGEGPLRGRVPGRGPWGRLRRNPPGAGQEPGAVLDPLLDQVRGHNGLGTGGVPRRHRRSEGDGVPGMGTHRLDPAACPRTRPSRIS